MSKLTQAFVKTVEAPGSYYDERGLMLVINKKGAKNWVLRYQLNGRRRDMGIGAFPAVSLKAARLSVDEHRLNISQGIDPLAKRDAERLNKQTLALQATTFKAEAERYISTHQESWKNARHAKAWANSLAEHVYPHIGDLPVSDIDTDQVLTVLLAIWSKIPETASRLRNRMELVLDAAKARRLRDGENPARWRGHLDKLLPRQKRTKVPFAAMPADEVGPFLRQLDSLDSTGARALELVIYTFARSAEVCKAEWPEVDLVAGVWTIPGERMKGGKTHRVPLCRGALEVFKQQQGKHELYVFPNARGSGCLPGNALRRVMDELGAHEYVPHGFRSTLRTWAADHTAHPREVCEMALAHGLEDKVEAAYNRAEMMEKRRQLMADWDRFVTAKAQITLRPSGRKRVTASLTAAAA